MSPRFAALVAVATVLAMASSVRADDTPGRGRGRLVTAPAARPAAGGAARAERDGTRGDDGDARGDDAGGDGGADDDANRRPSRLQPARGASPDDAPKRGGLPPLSGGARATLTRVLTSVYAVRACAGGGRSTCEQAARALPVVGALVGVATTTGAERALSAAMGAGEIARLGLAAAGAWRLDDDASAGLRVTLGGPGLLVSGTF